VIVGPERTRHIVTEAEETRAHLETHVKWFRVEYCLLVCAKESASWCQCLPTNARWISSRFLLRKITKIVCLQQKMPYIQFVASPLAEKLRVASPAAILHWHILKRVNALCFKGTCYWRLWIMNFGCLRCDAFVILSRLWFLHILIRYLWHFWFLGIKCLVQGLAS
jgi:hypothetical protein